MPIYDYRCTDCGTLYDVYHKVREAAEDVVCPSCQSHAHTKLMSVPGVAVSNHAERSCGECASENGGTCCGGACQMN